MKNENTLEEKRKYMKRKHQNNTNVFHLLLLYSATQEHLLRSGSGDRGKIFGCDLIGISELLDDERDERRLISLATMRSWSHIW